MKKNDTRERGKGGGNTLNTVVNVAVLLFLGYALLGSGGQSVRGRSAIRG